MTVMVLLSVPLPTTRDTLMAGMPEGERLEVKDWVALTVPQWVMLSDCWQ